MRLGRRCPSDCLAKHPSVTHPRRIFLLAIAALVIAAVGWHLYANREPSYQGKTLSEWLEEGFPDGDYSRDMPIDGLYSAVRATGRKSIPTLLRMLQTKDSPIQLKLMELAEKQSFVQVHFTPAHTYRRRAAQAFMILGPEASEAFPELVRLLHDPELADVVAPSMAMISSNAIPVLRSGLTNQHERIRVAVIRGLRLVGTNGWVAITDLMPRLHDSSPIVRYKAALALGSFGQEPDMVLPALFKSARDDSDILVRQLSIQAIGYFGNRASALVPTLRQLLSSTNAADIPLRLALTNALEKINPTAWPNGDAMRPADLPKNLP